MNPENYGSYIHTTKFTVTEIQYENTSNLSVDLMQLGNNDCISNDESLQRHNRFYRAISLLERTVKMLKLQQSRGLTNE